MINLWISLVTKNTNLLFLSSNFYYNIKNSLKEKSFKIKIQNIYRKQP